MKSQLVGSVHKTAFLQPVQVLLPNGTGSPSLALRVSSFTGEGHTPALVSAHLELSGIYTQRGCSQCLPGASKSSAPGAVEVGPETLFKDSDIFTTQNKNWKKGFHC